MGQRQHICLGSKIQLNCYSVTECILLSITELCSHFILSSPNLLLKAFIFSARIEIFLTHVSWLVGVNGKNFTSVWILRSSDFYSDFKSKKSVSLSITRLPDFILLAFGSLYKKILQLPFTEMFCQSQECTLFFTVFAAVLNSKQANEMVLLTFLDPIPGFRFLRL